MTEHPLSLTATATRYRVLRSVILEWCVQEFFPAPDFDANGEPIWWPGALEVHDLIVWSNGGQPHFDKQFFHRINAYCNKRHLHTFGQGKKPGRPRKSRLVVD